MTEREELIAVERAAASPDTVREALEAARDAARDAAEEMTTGRTSKLQFIIRKINEAIAALSPKPDGSVETRTFDIAGTKLTRQGKVLSIVCDDDAIANRVADQLRNVVTPGPLGTDAGEPVEGKFWLELREPRCVPERKGPFRFENASEVLREFMKARPQAMISVVTLSHDGPDFQDAPECLMMTDYRSRSTALKHIDSSGAALSAPAPAVSAEEIGPVITTELEQMYKDGVPMCMREGETTWRTYHAGFDLSMFAWRISNAILSLLAERAGR